MCGPDRDAGAMAYPRCGHCAGLFKGGSLTATCPLHPECTIGLLHHNCVRLHMERCHPDDDIPFGFGIDPILQARQAGWEDYYADQTRRFLEAQWRRMTHKIIRRWETESACLASNTRHQIRLARTFYDI